jgi:hypothetical protein
MLKKFFIRIFDIRRIIKRKNSQLREEREKLMAAEASNRILSSYLLCFVKETGEVRVKKSKIAEVLGRYRTDVSANDEEYIIKVKELTGSEQKMFKEPKVAWRRPGRGNGANAKAVNGGRGNKGKVNSHTEGGEGVAKN